VIAVSRWYQRVRWVGGCGESYPLISPARGRTCGRLVPVVMAVPPTAMPGGLAGWRCGSRGLLRAGHVVRQAVSR
jgi:hypothetical protein